MLTWFKAAQRLVEIHRGRGAKVPDPSVILNTMALLLELEDYGAIGSLPAPSRIVPCPIGFSILVTWEETAGEYLEAQVTPDGSIEWMHESKESANFWTGTDEAIKILQSFIPTPDEARTAG